MAEATFEYTRPTPFEVRAAIVCEHGRFDGESTDARGTPDLVAIRSLLARNHHGRYGCDCVLEDSPPVG